jgi:hypothetical protein
MNTERSGVVGVPVAMPGKYKIIGELSIDFDELSMKYRAMKTMNATISVDTDMKMQKTFVAVSRCRSELIYPTGLNDYAIDAVNEMVRELAEILDIELLEFAKNSGIVPQNIEDYACVCGNCPDYKPENLN